MVWTTIDCWLYVVVEVVAEDIAITDSLISFDSNSCLIL